MASTVPNTEHRPCEGCAFANWVRPQAFECRAHPPTADAKGERVWPVVRSDDWCHSWVAHGSADRDRGGAR